MWHYDCNTHIERRRVCDFSLISSVSCFLTSNKICEIWSPKQITTWLKWNEWIFFFWGGGSSVNTNRTFDFQLLVTINNYSWDWSSEFWPALDRRQTTVYQYFNYLSWQPHVILGLAEELNGKSWSVSLAWRKNLSPQVSSNYQRRLSKWSSE